MPPAAIDPELLGAFLDGSATAEERAQVMQLAVTSEHAMRELREATTLHAELTGEYVVWPASLETPRIGRRATPASIRVVLAATIAAALAGVIGVRALQRPAPAALAIAQVMPLDGARGAGAMTQLLGPGWRDGGLRVLRGAGDGPLAGESPDFRAGRVECALRRGDIGG